MQYLDMHLWLPNDILLKADKMTMSASLELRVPILDRVVFDTASKLPREYKIVGKDTTKYALRKAAAKIVPKEWAQREKKGFMVPFKYWLKEEKWYNKVKETFENHGNNQEVPNINSNYNNYGSTNNENFGVLPGVNKIEKEPINQEYIDLSSLLTPDKKIVTFVGTSKNGTSFIVNNLAQLLSTTGVNVAILDTTRNRNSYYIYTKNEEELREFSEILKKEKEHFSGNIRIGIPLNEKISHLCTAGTEKLDIKYDGTILPCPAFKELSEDELKKYGIKLYNIYDNLEEIKIPGKGTRVEPLCRKIYKR